MFSVIDIDTTYDGVAYQHQVVIHKGTVTLLDYPSVWLSHFSNHNTSKKYAKTICKFCNYLVNERLYQDEKAIKFWENATIRDIRAWKSSRMRKNFTNHTIKPSLKTIDDDALVVAKFLSWVKQICALDIPFETRTSISKRDLRVGQMHQISNSSARFSLAVSIAPDSDDYPLAGLACNTQSPKKWYLNDREIKVLIGAFSDEVYKYICLAGVMTGLRAFEVLRIPFYKIQSDNSIFSSDPVMLKKMLSTGQSDLHLQVLGKRNKLRQVRFSVYMWYQVMARWQPLFQKRKKIYIKKYGEDLSSNILWLDRSGEPIYTPISNHKIADKALSKLQSAFYYVSSKNRKKPLFEANLRNVTYYNLRHTFATKYVINIMEARRERDINTYIEDHSLRYDLAQQMGHSEIDTTFRYYVDNAIAVIKSREFGHSIFPNMEDFLD